MPSSCISCIAAAAALLALAGCATNQIHFGEPMTLAESDTISVGKLLANASAYDGKYVRVHGTVLAVCESKGCWMDIGSAADAEERLYVKFTCPVEGRLIPMEAAGHKAVVEGTLAVQEITESEARHYADEAGKSAEEIRAIQGPQKRIRLMAPAAAIRGLPAPASGA